MTPLDRSCSESITITVRRTSLIVQVDHSWYLAALRRKKIAEAKRLKAQAYIDEMNRKANERA
jgi:flagellar biogenesis protein FliO